MEIYKIQEITDYMESVYPSKPQSNYSAIAKKYIDICVYECLRGYSNKQDRDTIDFRISNLNENIHSRYDANKKWLPLLKEQFPMFNTIQRGWKSSGVSVLSSVKPLFTQLELVKYVLSTDQSEVIESLYPTTDSNITQTPIDIPNLKRYIRNIMIGIAENRFEYPQTMMNRVFSAKCILDIAQATGGVLSSQYETKATGRQYHKGINLQNCHTDVREAALGKCHKYDLSSSMYAVMLAVIGSRYQLDEQFLKRSMINYIVCNKKEVRSILAKDCLTNTNTSQEFKEKIVKRTLQKIGFGSNPNNAYGGIASEIYHQVDRMQFAKHWIVQGLMQEIELYKEIMRDSYPDAKKKYGDDLRKNGRSSLNKWCTYHYQCTESDIIANVKHYFTEQHILLQVHDALYMSAPVDLWELNTVAQKVSKHCVFEYELIEKEGTDRGTLQQADTIAQQHRKHITKEEQRATEHVLEFSNIHTTTGKDRIDRELELQQAWNTLMEKR